MAPLRQCGFPARFNLMDVNRWLSNCLLDVPTRPTTDEATDTTDRATRPLFRVRGCPLEGRLEVALFYRNTFTGSMLECKYGRDSAVFKCRTGKRRARSEEQQASAC